jgi:hypothetical protein
MDLYDVDNDCLGIIFEALDFPSKCSFRAVCRRFRRYHTQEIPIGLHHLLTDDILEYYPNLRTLNANNNPHITAYGLQYVPRLTTLFACYESGITTKALRFTPALRTLYACYNDFISRRCLAFLPHLTTLYTCQNDNFFPEDTTEVNKKRTLNPHEYMGMGSRSVGDRSVGDRSVGTGSSSASGDNNLLTAYKRQKK